MSDLTDKHEYVVSLTDRQACALRYIAHERIIRCRDCGRLMDHVFCWCFKHHDYVDPDDFCSWAEPREES